MIDILTLVVSPAVLLIICIVCVVNHNNKIATSDKLDNRIIKISKRPRVIRDKNHKLSEMNKLLLPEKDDSFNADMTNFIGKSLKKASRNIL